MWPFSHFQYGSKSSWSTAHLLTAVSGRIFRAFNWSDTTRAVALDISKAFDRFWHAGLLHKLKSYGISGPAFGIVSSSVSNRWLRVVLAGKSSQEYPVNAGVSQGSIFSPTLFLLYINDLTVDVVCNIAIYADDTTLYSKWTIFGQFFWTISKTLNSDKVRLNWAMKLKFSGNTSLKETNKW